MQNRGRGLALAGLAVVALAILFVVLSGGEEGDDSSGDQPTVEQSTTSPAENGTSTATTTTEPKPEVPTIVVEDGQPVGGLQDLEFAEGEDIRFRVDSDTAAEVHFHGYDIAKDVEAGGSVEFDVPATIPGVFEVELEETATQIAEVTVD